jgi:RNA polymerase sigma-70 factor (ECF subfamily)
MTQDRRALEDCLAALPPEIAAAVLMRYRDGMSWAQIAEAVETPMDTIRMRVQRGALKSLRECLEAHEVTP